MPTLTWIQERGEERYEHPLNIRLTSPIRCPFCGRLFETPDAHQTSRLVVRHIGRDHPLQRPVLLVGDRILGPNSTITRFPKPEDISIENTKAIHAEVDGEPERAVTANDVRRLLTERSRRFLRLRLINGRDEDSAAATVDFRFDEHAGEVKVPQHWTISRKCA
jgi:hypothetical protein